MIKSIRMRWAGRRSGTYRALVGDLMERGHLEHPGIDVSIMLNWIFKKWDGKSWRELIWLRVGTGGGLLRMR